MDEKSLEILEFPQIKQILAGFTSFSASHQLALDLLPSSDHQQVAQLLQQSAEARHLLDLEPSFSIGGVIDVRSDVKMASVGKVLEPQSLLDIQQTLAAAGLVRQRLEKLADELPLLWNIASRLVEFDSVVRSIARTLAPNGQLLDNATSNLAGIRQQLRELRQRLNDRLEAIMRTPRGQRIIQEPVITEREGRYVIPIKIEHRKEIKGIVHDVSNTGVTVFIEPWVTTEMGNTLRELETEERREVEKILRDLSTEVGIHEAEISQDIALIAELDLLLAKARYARKLKAVEPVLTDFSEEKDNKPTGVLKLIEARHPLLGNTAVPLSVEMGRDFLVLIITGPNTGGKTVALKTIGLLSLMTQCGIPIPAAADSQIPIFDNIFADIGDEQSIAQTLSTFSWHVGNIVRIINQATSRSLVLLDELGTSTDPVEGSALAVAILRHFLSHGTLTVATTHFSEVKAFAQATTGMQNASFDFDPATLMPTYRLTLGIPGGSNALAVARRLGLLPEIVTEAERIIPEGIRELETLLTSLKSKEQEVSILQRQLAREKEEAARHNRELAAEQERLTLETRNLIQEARDRVTREIVALNQQIRDATAELRREKSREKVEQARKVLTAAHEQLKSGALQTQGDEEIVDTDKTEIAVGDTVSIREVSMKATVLSLSAERNEVEVQAGQARLTLGLDKVDKVSSEGRAAAATPIKVKMVARSVSRELDLRGKRAEEVQPLLDRYLNEATLANLKEVRIIHGFGTGVVRQIVRDSLVTHPLVKSSRPGKRDEGGDGVTVAQL
ncbi:MAG: endonuclease MutS2 [Chloroflexota bacterium]